MPVQSSKFYQSPFVISWDTLENDPGSTKESEFSLKANRFAWIWIWTVSRQGPKLGHRTDELHAYGEIWRVSWLLNCAEEPAETTDWGRAPGT